MKLQRLHRSVSAVVVLTLAALTLAGCGNDDAGSSGKVRVVAAFYPLAWAAREVGGSDVSVTDLTTPGVEPHDLELKVRQTAQVSEADLVVYEKQFQPAVDSAVKENAKSSFDVSDVVKLHQTSEGPDPHFWQDPLRMKAYVDALGTRFAKIDPAHAAAYHQRADALGAKLTALNADYRSGLATCKVSTIVVSHDAFNYLAKYGITVAGIAGLSPDAEPSAAHIQQLQDLIRTDGVTTVFSEVLASPKLADALSHDLGLKSEVLDPIEGVSKDAPAGTTYLTIMRSNLAKLRTADSCT
ncbi:MAG: periplasmic solute binding protein [Nocardioidaceae bacterium]|nr:periplasmic solute binding protein [Nocardioidaceae bacterium]